VGERNKDLFPNASIKTRDQLIEVLHQTFALLDGSLRMDVDTINAEGDRVVAQVRSHALTKQDKRYESGFRH
jgi:hypothetical protein